MLERIVALAVVVAALVVASHFVAERAPHAPASASGSAPAPAPGAGPAPPAAAPPRASQLLHAGPLQVWLGEDGAPKPPKKEKKHHED